MKVRVGHRFSLVDINMVKIKNIEELQKELKIENFFPNTFQIVEGSVDECLLFIALFGFDSLASIKCFYGQQFDLFYKPYMLSNEILIQDTETFNQVEKFIREFMFKDKYKPIKQIN